MAKVTVLIPTFNSGGYLKEAVQSVLTQSFSDWKLIIIDDNSTDNSIKNLGNLLDDSRIEIIYNKENLGQGKSLNIGLAKVASQYVIQLDADDWFEPNTLDLLVKEMDKQADDVAVIGGNTRFVIQDKNGKIKRTKIKQGRAFKNKYDFLLANTSIMPRFYRTSALKDVGGWPTNDPHEGRYAEDMIILINLIAKYRIHWINEILYNYRLHVSNLSNSRKKFAEVIKYTINNALKEWGNLYTPVYHIAKGGWLILASLTPRKSKVDNKVTVLITAYNSGKYLREAVDSVLKQSYGRWKLIIIDDYSTDDSIKLIEKELEDPRIRLIKNRENIGQAKCLNIGLYHVDTPYLIQLDADDWFEPNTLEKMLGVMEKLPKNFAVVSGNMNTVYENETGEIIKKTVRKGRSFKNKYDFLLYNASVWPRFYRTNALIEVGGWPVNGPYEGRYIEDLRILFRLIEKYKFYWIDEVFYNYRRHSTNQTKDITPMVETLEWLIRFTLKRWGNHYKPIFHKTKKGYLKVQRLTSVNNGNYHRQSKIKNKKKKR